MTDGHCWDRKTAALIQLFGLLAADSTVVFGFIRESTTNHGLYSLTHTPSCSLFTQLPDTAIQSPLLALCLLPLSSSALFMKPSHRPITLSSGDPVMVGMGGGGCPAVQIWSVRGP